MTTLPLPTAVLQGEILPAQPGQAGAGFNAGGRALTRANSDAQAVWEWFERYIDAQASKHTLEGYYREAERLLAWCIARGRTLSQLLPDDMRVYAAFLVDPPAEWCLQPIPRFLDGKENPAWFDVRKEPRWLGPKDARKPNPAWRPFVSGLSASGSKQALSVVNNLLNYLVGTGYLAHNALKVSRTRVKQARRPKQIERYLEPDTWLFVLDHIETWPKDTPRVAAHYHRAKCLFSLAYLLGLRRFELAQATTADVEFIRGAYWLRVRGKGKVEALVPLQDDALQTIQEYRVSLGRPAMWDFAQPEPLIMDVCGKGRPLGVKAVHHVVKAVFASAAAACPNPYQVEKLKLASAHWLRHTSATAQLSQDGANLDLLTVQSNMRHGSLATTQLYLHVDSVRQAQDTQRHKLRKNEN